MPGPSENVPARAAVWPGVSRRRIGAMLAREGSRLNTPFRRTLVRVLARERGGRNRSRILKLLSETGPLNANQIACALDLHYTTVKHHLEKLVKDDILASNPRGDAYGAAFFLTYQMEREAPFLDEVLRTLEEPAEATPRIGLVSQNRGAVSQ